MNKIQAIIVADSIDPRGNRITSFLLTYPRFIHSELMTHRMFSRNSASSRAIPFEKMVKMVEENPFIPIAWQKDHKGMQGTEYFTDKQSISECIQTWLVARNNAIDESKILNQIGATKQLCNRLLEPFMWHTTLITATEFSNFFELRCPKYESYDMLTGNHQFFRSKKDWLKYFNEKPLPKASHINKIPETIEEWLFIDKSGAEIHIQALAEAMWDARNMSTPKHLEEGQWHIPFGDKIDPNFLITPSENAQIGRLENITLGKLKITTANCARISYNNHDGEINYQKDIELHDRLLASHHMSPFEHVARVMTEIEYDSFFKGRTYVNQNEPNYKELNNFYRENGHGWCNNFRGFIPYRYLIENEKI